MSKEIYDLFIVGGGVNGVGIARDGAGRGYSIYLAEMGDLASGTSSAATKLIHGGLRYLEYYEFHLVREALIEREILWDMAPHIIHPLRFILPYHKGLRPKWMLRLGLFLYDYIGGRKKLPATKTINLSKDITGEPLRANSKVGFEYSDCFVDDARLVVVNAMDAAQKGASINTQTKLISAKKQNEIWELEVEDVINGERDIILAKMLINAAGPWVDNVLGEIENYKDEQNVRLVKGSHIVVNRLFDHDRAYIFQNADNRIIFAIPYEKDFTLIGTTDVDYSGNPTDVSISSDELNYLCEVSSHYFKQQVERSDVVWAYSGVRPLYDDGASKAQETTREFVLRLENEQQAPLLNIFGGKLTTYRKLAEEALEQIGKAIGKKGEAWTVNATLPGGDFPIDGFEELVNILNKEYSFLPRKQISRLAKLYGTKTRDVLKKANNLGSLGENFGAYLSACEVDYLVENEWAKSVEDILWRRTKLGLTMKERDRRALSKYLVKNHNHAEKSPPAIKLQ